MSVCTRAECPHGRGVFIWLDGEPYAWVHDTSGEDGRGRLDVCDLMEPATAQEAGEVCACGHPSADHHAESGGIPPGMLASPRSCSCGCDDFRHRPEDLAKRRESAAREPAPGPARAASPLDSPAPAQSPSVQLELFAPAPALRSLEPGARGIRARKAPASRIETVRVGGAL